MALMRQLDLAGGNAMIWFLITQTPPAGGFALAQVDPASDAAIYFSSTAAMTAIPLPAALPLFAAGLAALLAFARRHCSAGRSGHVRGPTPGLPSHEPAAT